MDRDYFFSLILLILRPIRIRAHISFGLGKYSDPKLLSSFFPEALLPKQRKQQGQDDTDQNRGNNGKVESEVLFPDDNISGKSSDPRNFLPDH
jgi:hypothetical protein